MSKLVTVASYLNPALAQLARIRLESADIPAFLANEHLIGVQWVYGTAVGGVELRVTEDDAERALAVLTEEEPEAPRAMVMAAEEELPPEATLDWSRPEPVCPQCGGTDIQPGIWHCLSLAATFLFMLPTPLFRNRLECGQCGHTWKRFPEKP